MILNASGIRFKVKIRLSWKEEAALILTVRSQLLLSGECSVKSSSFLTPQNAEGPSADTVLEGIALSQSIEEDEVRILNFEHGTLPLSFFS
jgi:hypothetical protein